MPEPGARRGPKAGWIAAAAAAVVVLAIVAAMRGGETPPTVANAPRSGVSTPLANAPASNAGAPAPPLTGAPAANRPAIAAVPAPGNSPRPAAPTPPQDLPPSPPVKPSDLPPDHPPITTDERPQISIQWLGEACVYIHSPGGVAVVTDPFDPKATGLPAPSTGAHAVLVSADSPAHSFTEAVHAFEGETKQVVRGSAYHRGDMQVTPLPGPDGRAFGYLIQAGTLRIGFAGTPAGLRALDKGVAPGSLDLLLLPVGEDPKVAARTAQRLKPRVVIPLSYAAPGMEGPASRLHPLRDFVAGVPFAVTEKDSDVMMLSQADLPPSTEVYALRFRR
jgi:L-ascorbate metabolism protein UlaG (beta-lactamase superfamily)